MTYGSTVKPISYLYDIGGHDVIVTREYAGSAYPRNGNDGAATKYFIWASTVNGKTAGVHCYTRASAYEHARAQIEGIPYYDHPNYPARARNVRSWVAVQREMRANYRGRRVGAAAASR